MPTTLTPALLARLFPAERANAFFEALYGDAAEGAYDIELAPDHETPTPEDSELRFFFLLHQRAGHCLACNLTTGLPQVFERHPVIDLKGLCTTLATHAGWELDDVWWHVGATESVSTTVHRIPFILLRHSA